MSVDSVFWAFDIFNGGDVEKSRELIGKKIEEACLLYTSFSSIPPFFFNMVPAAVNCQDQRNLCRSIEALGCIAVNRAHDVAVIVAHDLPLRAPSRRIVAVFNEIVRKEPVAAFADYLFAV